MSIFTSSSEHTHKTKTRLICESEQDCNSNTQLAPNSSSHSHCSLTRTHFNHRTPEHEHTYILWNTHLPHTVTTTQRSNITRNPKFWHQTRLGNLANIAFADDEQGKHRGGREEFNSQQELLRTPENRAYITEERIRGEMGSVEGEIWRALGRKREMWREL